MLTGTHPNPTNHHTFNTPPATATSHAETRVDSATEAEFRENRNLLHWVQSKLSAPKERSPLMYLDFSLVINELVQSPEVQKVLASSGNDQDQKEKYFLSPLPSEQKNAILGTLREIVQLKKQFDALEKHVTEILQQEKTDWSAIIQLANHLLDLHRHGNIDRISSPLSPPSTAREKDQTASSQLKLIASINPQIQKVFGFSAQELYIAASKMQAAFSLIVNQAVDVIFKKSGLEPTISQRALTATPRWKIWNHTNKLIWAANLATTIAVQTRNSIGGFVFRDRDRDEFLGDINTYLENHESALLEKVSQCYTELVGEYLDYKVIKTGDKPGSQSTISSKLLDDSADLVMREMGKLLIYEEDYDAIKEPQLKRHNELELAIHAMQKLSLYIKTKLHDSLRTALYQNLGQ